MLQRIRYNNRRFAWGMGCGLVALVCGCGYQAYTERFTDTLADLDFRDKVEKTLEAQPLGSADLGVALRPPKEVRPAALELAEKAHVSAIFEAPPELARGVRVVVYVRRPTETNPTIPTLEELIKEVFQPELAHAWYGPDIPSEIKVEKEYVPIAGPKVKPRPTDRITRVFDVVRLEQALTGPDPITPAGTAVSEQPASSAPRVYSWYIFFVENPETPNVRAMVAYRYLKDDENFPIYTAGDGDIVTLRESVLISAGTIQLIEPLPASASPGQKGVKAAPARGV